MCNALPLDDRGRENMREFSQALYFILMSEDRTHQFLCKYIFPIMIAPIVAVFLLPHQACVAIVRHSTNVYLMSYHFPWVATYPNPHSIEPHERHKCSFIWTQNKAELATAAWERNYCGKFQKWK